MLSDVEGFGGVASVLSVHSFFINENWIWAMTRHHAQSSNISLTRNRLFDSDIRQ